MCGPSQINPEMTLPNEQSDDQREDVACGHHLAQWSQDPTLLLLASLADLNSFIRFWTQRSAGSPDVAWKSSIDVSQFRTQALEPDCLHCWLTVSAFKAVMSASPPGRAVVGMKQGAQCMAPSTDPTRAHAHTHHHPQQQAPSAQSFLEYVVKNGALEMEAEPVGLPELQISYQSGGEGAWVWSWPFQDSMKVAR